MQFPAWQEYYEDGTRDDAAVGIWHETYVVDPDEYETIYNNMPLGGRFGASALAVAMVVAMSAAGPNLLNGAVLVSSLVVVLLGIGRYSLWDPAVPDLVRTARGLPNGDV